jgi:hypothetical protein
LAVSGFKNSPVVTYAFALTWRVGLNLIYCLKVAANGELYFYLLSI